MKKMYLLTIIIIAIITLIFLLFCKDENSEAISYLNTFGYETSSTPDSTTLYRIPKIFDDTLYEYNLLQLSQGFDLTLYTGITARKYTYRIKNIPYPLYADIFLVNGKIIAADLVNPGIDGFTFPLIHINELIKYHNPATNDAVIP